MCIRDSARLNRFDDEAVRRCQSLSMRNYQQRNEDVVQSLALGDLHEKQSTTLLNMFIFSRSVWSVNQLLSMHKDDGKKGIDFLLVANMYSLLNQNAQDNGILDTCHKAGVKVIIGGSFSSILIAT